ncbi:tyrosine-type recombinase/integrase [Acidisoma cellulosilytica]|uniref:Tyrosine-type recombinase/integrase n=1 Tax=Acidisoma cellulosilyticum TaxID=2802395 RepID=A0A964E4N1_9PROT|nr:tyrosine-type recombinase/integrase [Acidisoma cellulosilyticum]MCB8881669.1 tyrosine-type recombinase/integrase [Acidisoma cellulosilyticum]
MPPPLIQPAKGPSADPNHNLQLRGSTWYVRFKLGGKPQLQSLGTADVKAARRARDKILKENKALRSGIVREAEKTWQDAVNGYLDHTKQLVANRSLSEKTVQRYGVSLVQLTLALAGDPDENGVFPPVPLSAITVGTLKDYSKARFEEGRSTSTILNDLTAMSRALQFAVVSGWVEQNVAKTFDRDMFVGTTVDDLDPPTDEQAQALIDEVAEWSADMATLFRFLRETGMRLAEALHLHAEDIHPDVVRATLIRGVKRNRDGLKTRIINLGRAAELLPVLPKRGRLFARLHADSAVVSTRYGQWRRQRQGREEKSAADEGRDPETLQKFRIHDFRHSFAIASVLDDDTCLYRLSEHLGHSSIKTTEKYTRFLRGMGAHRQYGRRTDLFGSLPAALK